MLDILSRRDSGRLINRLPLPIQRDRYLHMMMICGYVFNPRHGISSILINRYNRRNGNIKHAFLDHLIQFLLDFFLRAPRQGSGPGRRIKELMNRFRPAAVQKPDQDEKKQHCQNATDPLPSISAFLIIFLIKPFVL